MSRALFALLAAGALASGCAQQAFSAHARDNDIADLRRALALSRQPAAGPQASSGPMAFVVTTGPTRELAAVDLQRGTVLWKRAADVRSRIAVGKGLIAHRQGEHEIIGRDPLSGEAKLKVTLGNGERFMGLAIDDDHLYYVVQGADASKRTSYTVAVDRSGHELWRTPAPGTLGGPAARGGLVVVPFASQNLSLLDGATGKEVGRVRATDEEITFARGTPQGLFYGGTKGVYLLDEKSVAGSRQGSSYIEAKLGSDQIRPFYAWNAYDASQADYSAFDRNRLLWRASAAGAGFRFDDDLAVLHSFRYLFAFDTKTGHIRWAYSNPRVDVVGAEDAGSAIVFADTNGDIGALDAKSGRAQIIAKTGLHLQGATLDADGLRVEGPNNQSSEDTQATVAAALDKIVWDPDARFTAVKVFAVGALGDIPGPEATAALVKIVRAQVGVSRPVQKRAGDALIARKDATAGKLFLEGLAVHGDFLADRRAVGVDALARAAAEIGSKEAAPLIGAHLADPQTPQAELNDLVAALAKLGGKDAARALRNFLLVYRADPMFLQDPSSLVAAGVALAALGGDDRRTVAFVAGEKRTLPPVAQALASTLAAPPAKAPAPSKK